MSAPRGPLEAGAIRLATLFGAGRAAVAPGTVGTLAALPFAVAAGHFLPAWAYALVTVLLSGAAIWSAGVAARALRRHDPQPVVIDEAAGIFVTLLWVPPAPFTVFGGFLLFRVFDVLKPPPARGAERLAGGWGIVTDDLIAGAYANLALQIALYVRLLP
ncbi:MAG: phosphatidylglycerophosphatase A family protein [Candidatus Polarisedimenticolia bacterium]